MVVNPQVEFKNQVYISNYCEINSNSTFKEIFKLLTHICLEFTFPFNKVYKESCWPSFIKFQVPKNFQSNIP
jgi:hypothetical protein